MKFESTKYFKDFWRFIFNLLRNIKGVFFYAEMSVILQTVYLPSLAIVLHLFELIFHLVSPKTPNEIHSKKYLIISEKFVLIAIEAHFII